VASELGALLASGLVRPRLDRTSVDAFLAFGYLPPDRTIYANVRTLPPGHVLEWTGGEPRIERYWRPDLETRSIGLEEAAERLRELLEQAVRRQMVADVPVGAFLSGGHDSSTIVALMQKQTSRPVKTFLGRLFPADRRATLRARGCRALPHGASRDRPGGAPDVGPLLETMVAV
jgi:asparagine synthase (glutamine-hydrolysing)